MRCSHFFIFSALLFCATVWSPCATHGQTLSIVKQGERNYWIEASAPADNPHTLQASANLHLWIDLEENVSEHLSLSLTNAGLSYRYFRLTPTAPPALNIRVMLLGDSLGSDCCGWGGGMYGYFKPNATFINYALPNTSTKSFLQSPEKDRMLLVKPNYVLINHGLIDDSADVAKQTTLEEFDINLRTIVNMVRGFGGVPILIGVHAPRLWDEDGTLAEGWSDRNAITKEVATDLNALFIDLDQITREVFTELGPSGTAFMTFIHFPNDYMHFSPPGAQYVARLVVNALPDSFGPYLIGILDPPPIP